MAERDAASLHLSVMPAEALSLLGVANGGTFVDCTLGLGGHTEAILSANNVTRVIGIDQDDDALALAAKRLERFGGRFTSIKANFAAIGDVVAEQVDGILADLGVSSLQLDSETRGFSFRYDAPLDMRMDAESDGETVAELLERVDEKELADIIYRFGEERHSRRIARRIIEKRKAGEPVRTTAELADLVKRSVPFNPKDKIHPATRTFQALRIAVNDELEILEQFIKDAVEILKTEGVLAIITFHSLEDRIVKHAFQRLAGKCICPPRQPQCTCGAVKKVEVLTKKPILPTEDEQRHNPRSRSAKLRACKKI
ncbi:MAG TPA: 16S rRNA (cytosine(1402)-N(4))-methyltransferase RsmH [Pyrinomonadaceae bacterium]|nr:16S rRNA (cytosine(1402)-N(4))-methyltransferase RsmH [Pyrinomonadaceae bacterium]